MGALPPWTDKSTQLSMNSNDNNSNMTDKFNDDIWQGNGNDKVVDVLKMLSKDTKSDEIGNKNQVSNEN